jgi:hypothetical protein
MLARVKGDASAPYRVAPPLPPDPYLIAWEQLRRRRLAAFVLFLSVLPVGVISFGVMGKPYGPYVLVPFIAANLVAGLRVRLFRCPKCGDFFTSKDWAGLAFGRRYLRQMNCLHCGIAVDTPAPSPSELQS